MNHYDVIVVGAGACGLYCARTLAKRGKKVLILEARDRIGGRIYPLESKLYGMSSERGAEWIHGDAPITRALLTEAGLTFVPESGGAWSTRDGTLQNLSTYHDTFPEFIEKAKNLAEDMSVGEFIEKFMPHIRTEKNYIVLKEYIEGYHAGDIHLMSTKECVRFLGADSPTPDGWIKEGYAALLDYLLKKNDELGVELLLQKEVVSITQDTGIVTVTDAAGAMYKAGHCVITVPLPLYSKGLRAPLNENVQTSLADIGFGGATKVLIRFKTRWWDESYKGALKDMSFMLADDTFITWWVQKDEPVMVGWLAGPSTHSFDNSSDEEIVEKCLESCARVFEVDINFVKAVCEHTCVTHWNKDPYVKGAYSYALIKTRQARERINADSEGRVFVAGEAFPNSGTSATVEGAFENASEVSKKII